MPKDAFHATLCEPNSFITILDSQTYTYKDEDASKMKNTGQISPRIEEADVECYKDRTITNSDVQALYHEQSVFYKEAPLTVILAPDSSLKQYKLSGSGYVSARVYRTRVRRTWIKIETHTTPNNDRSVIFQMNWPSTYRILSQRTNLRLSIPSQHDESLKHLPLVLQHEDLLRSNPLAVFETAQMLAEKLQRDFWEWIPSPLNPVFHRLLEEGYEKGYIRVMVKDAISPISDFPNTRELIRVMADCVECTFF